MTLLGAGRRASKKRPADPGGIALASIGPVTSATLRELHLGVDVEAKQYTIPGLIKPSSSTRLPFERPHRRTDDQAAATGQTEGPRRMTAGQIRNASGGLRLDLAAAIGRRHVCFQEIRHPLLSVDLVVDA